MPKFVHVKKARETDKERKCCRCGRAIKAGESYVWTSFLIRPRGSLTRNWCDEHSQPKASETTLNDKLSTLYRAQEELNDAIQGASTFQELIDALREAQSQASDSGNEYTEARDNMPENLQDGDAGTRLQEQADHCESWSSELDEAADEIEAWQEVEEEDEQEKKPKDKPDVAETEDKAEPEEVENDEQDPNWENALERAQQACDSLEIV